MGLRYYSNTAAPTTLNGTSVSGSTTTIVVVSVTGLPISFPYTLVLDKGTSSEEIVTVTAAAGASLTVTRGVDGTTGVPHAGNATVTHCVTAQDYTDSRNHETATASIHGLAGGSAIVGTTTSQALTNKTMDRFALTSGNAVIESTGILSTNGNITGDVVKGNKITNAALSASIEGNGDILTGTRVNAAGELQSTTMRFGSVSDSVAFQTESSTTITAKNTSTSVWATIKAGAFAVQSRRASKKKIKPTRYGLADVLTLRPVDFRYRDAPSIPQTGFVAEDLADVYPEAVTFTAEGEPDGVDLSKLVPVLVRAVQELAQRVSDLEG